MYGTRNRSPADAEVNEVLTAISQVSGIDPANYQALLTDVEGLSNGK